MSAPLAAARAAYSRPEAPARTPRAVEYDLIARATARLSDAWARRDADLRGLLSAVDDNLRIWATLAVTVADPANALPAPLRVQLFYLYEFTARHSCALRQGKASAEVLIDINTAVLRGLRGEGGAA